MKLSIFYFLLVFLTLLGTQFPIASGVTLADFGCFLLGIACILNLLSKNWRLDTISRYTFGYVCFMALASILNSTYVNTIFINYFRIFVSGLVIYIVIRNTCTSTEKIKVFSILLIIFSFIFAFLTRNMIAESMANASNYVSINFGYGRNNWAFTNLLLLIALVFIDYKQNINRYYKYSTIILFPIFAFNIYLTASRFSLIGLIIFLVFFRIWMKKKLSAGEFVLILASIVIVPYVASYLVGGIDLDFLEQRQATFDNKIGGTNDELVNGRLMALNIEPIINSIDKSNIFNLIFGDGLCITHGILSHVFISTGILSLLYFVYYNAAIIIKYLKFRGTGYFISFIVALMFVNDLVTNSRFIIGINNMLYMLLVAYFVNILRCNRNARTRISV